MFFFMRINLHEKQIDASVRMTTISLVFLKKNQIKISKICGLKLLEIIESLHCIIDYLTNI